MKRDPSRILAIHPGHGGFGFVVMESPEQIVDWGIKACPSTDAVCILRRIVALTDQYRPGVLLLTVRTNRRRNPRLLRLIKGIRVACRKQGVAPRAISREAIHALFSRYGRTKNELALAVVHKLPQLSRWFPRKRRMWGGEDHRMKIFEAALLALAFYAASSERPSSAARHRSTYSTNSDS